MNRDDMLSELRTLLDDVYIPQMWTDQTLLSLLAEGQDKFCEDTGYFTDFSNFTLTLQTGVGVYPVPDRVIELIDIWDGTRKLAKIPTGQRFDDEFGVLGEPNRWQTDQETGVIKFYPVPMAAVDGKVLTLQVWRYSLYDLAGNGATPEEGDPGPAAPEIPSRFQRACIEWAAYGAFQYITEKQSMSAAETHKKRFEAYVSDGRRFLRRFQNMETRVGTDPAYRT